MPKTLTDSVLKPGDDITIRRGETVLYKARLEETRVIHHTIRCADCSTRQEFPGTFAANRELRNAFLLCHRSCHVYETCKACDATGSDDDGAPCTACDGEGELRHAAAREGASS